MAIEIRKREGESPSSLVSRFVRRVQQSGILREAKRFRFHQRPINRSKRRLSALHREQKLKEIMRAKKLGIL